jgi:hypothetical protein
MSYYQNLEIFILFTLYHIYKKLISIMMNIFLYLFKLRIHI